MPSGRGKKKGKVLGISILAFVLGTFFGAGIYYLHLPARPSSSEEWPDVERWLENARGSYTNIAAVRSGPEPGGVLCGLAVKIEPGAGHVYVAIDPVLVGFDFQDASRKAVEAACAHTGYPLDADGVGISGLEVFFLVSAPGAEQIVVQAIDGPSAGAATALVTIAALENKRVKEDYLITGTIEANGSIGPVGGIYYKAEAAKNSGVTHFLVPKGQSVVMMYRQVVEQIGPFRWVTYEPLRIDLNQYAREQGWNLEIIEVLTIEEAARLMLE